jgi:transposase
MRRTFNGLAIDARERIGNEPVSGTFRFFFNRNRTICKIILWASGGFCLFAKRLSKGSSKAPRIPPTGTQHVEMEACEVALILEGISSKQLG